MENHPALSSSNFYGNANGWILRKVWWFLRSSVHRPTERHTDIRSFKMRFRVDIEIFFCPFVSIDVFHKNTRIRLTYWDNVQARMTQRPPPPTQQYVTYTCRWSEGRLNRGRSLGEMIIWSKTSWSVAVNISQNMATKWCVQETLLLANCFMLHHQLNNTKHFHYTPDSHFWVQH